MDPGVLLGGSLLAATVAGTIALLAPCCFSVMLPAYFAGSVQNRGALVGMTLVYAIGVATVILPLALGAVVPATGPTTSAPPSASNHRPDHGRSGRLPAPL